MIKLLTLPALITALVLVTLFPNEAWSQGTLTQLVDNGPTDKRLNIVIFSEGYTFMESTQFDTDAADLTDYVFTTSPFAEYGSYFNVFAIWVASIESGSDHPSQGIYRNTYFNSTYDSYGIPRALTIPPNDLDPNWSHGAGKVYSLLQTHMPEYDIVLIVVNDPEYGGTGGEFAISSVHESAPEIVMHELGHSFGELADEYDTYTPGYYGHEGPNTTAETVRELIKWNAWILPVTPVPTPESETYADVVGLFEGACYETEDWYRPRLDCKMKALYNDFGEVCKEQLVKSEYLVLSPIEAYLPLASTITLSPTDTVSLEVVPMVPSGHDLDVQWYVNSVKVPGAIASTFQVSTAHLGGGTREVTAEVSDNTDLVRIDPYNLLSDSHNWTVICESSCGDVDGSDEVDIDDAVYLVNYIFAGGPPPEPLQDGDVNCSGNVDIDDVVYLIGYIFSGGPEPCSEC